MSPRQRGAHFSWRRRALQIEKETDMAAEISGRLALDLLTGFRYDSVIGRGRHGMTDVKRGNRDNSVTTSGTDVDGVLSAMTDVRHVILVSRGLSAD
ncbi:hypothetical protein BaRGS_00014530 [Batillaria attramentaria]|uniref:Uncharacterized protein n=1 Tax=Batillaria attramentaria TaxID=370345 RepID=A0ABD0L4M1_9CAEN